MADPMQQARELLAAEYRREGLYGTVDHTHGAATRAALAAIAAALRAAPEGFVLVPVEPTNEMREAAASFGGRGGYSAQRGDDAVDAWADMLAARPQGVK